MVKCPKVQCSPMLQYTPERECCPVCDLQLTATTYNTDNYFNYFHCVEDGIQYQNGESWKRNPCVTCTCEDGFPLCISLQCIFPSCDNPIQRPDQCCLTCPPTVSSPSSMASASLNNCKYHDRTYRDREYWNSSSDPCKTYFCDKGEVVPIMESCYILCDNPIYLENTCCPICPGISLVK